MNRQTPSPVSIPLCSSTARLSGGVVAAMGKRLLGAAKDGMGRVGQPIRTSSLRPAIVLLGTLGTVLAWSMPASATDGVGEINQTCATQTGCFAGDAAGFPVTINGSAGRSYRLTSDLVVPNENTDGILISTDDVGIDLNNFRIQGPVVCSGTGPTCTPSTGTGSGVDITSSALSGISVRNGSIRGMGSYGVFLGVQAEVTHVRARSNGVIGIYVNDGSTISGNTVYQNGGGGILAEAGSTVAGNTVYDNAFVGIYVLSGSTVSGNTVYGNGSDGITASTGATVSGNTAYNSGTDGISVGTGSTVSGNTVYNSGAHGITAGGGSTVWGNTVRSNTGFGLSLGTQSGYRENVITSNTAGTVNGTSLVNLGSNACDGSTICP